MIRISLSLCFFISSFVCFDRLNYVQTDKITDSSNPNNTYNEENKPSISEVKENDEAAAPTEPPTQGPAIMPDSGLKNTINETFVDLPEPLVCGVSKAKLNKIVNGVPAKLGDFPWMALLGYRGLTGPSWLCGGSIISSRHVLTAAHCILEELYLVRVGELDWARDDDGATPIDLHIVSAIRHEKYHIKRHTDDIGILTLEHTVQFTDLIRPICMPITPELRSNTFEDFNPFVAGWGALNYTGPSASHLQIAQVEVVSNEKCGQAYARRRIDDRRLCAGKGEKDSCSGDSGGPLMQPVFSNRQFCFYQIGVVSFGRGCAEADHPGVYTRVTHYIPWITEKVTGHN